MLSIAIHPKERQVFANHTIVPEALEGFIRNRRAGFLQNAQQTSRKGCAVTNRDESAVGAVTEDFARPARAIGGDDWQTDCQRLD